MAIRLALLLLLPLLLQDRNTFRRHFRGAGLDGRRELIEKLGEAEARTVVDCAIEGARILIPEYEELMTKRATLVIRPLTDDRSQFRQSARLDTKILEAAELLAGFQAHLEKVDRREALDRIGERLEKVKDPEGRAWLIRAASALGLEEGLDRIAVKDDDPGVRLAVFEASDSFSDVKALRESLEGPWQLQVEALETIDSAGVTRTAPAVLELVHSPRKKVRDQAMTTMGALTGAGSLATGEAWDRWWEDHGESFMKGEYKPPAGTGGKFTQTMFYGQPLGSDRLLFVLDISSSMTEAALWVPKDFAKEEPTKLDVAIFEIERAIRRLPETSEFNIVVFSEVERAWRWGLVPVAKKSIERSLRWLKKQNCGLETNTLSALVAAMTMAPPVARVKGDSAPDTLVFVSDGVASVGGALKPARILETVRRLNVERGLTIHTVFLAGPRENENKAGAELMKSLAGIGGGSFTEK